MIIKRRTLLLTGAAGLTTLAAPAILRAQGAPLKVGTYGGYFEESFKTHIYPDFTAETGIEIESIAEPTARPGSCSSSRRRGEPGARRTCP
jgi:putative spermidine/putrescine transport system substrate-binding protein